MFLVDLCVSTYSIVNRSGLLNFLPLKRLFIWAYFLYKRHHEDSFYPLLKKYPWLLENGNVIDIGANVGYTTLLFAEFLSKDYKIYAFEPEEENYKNLVYQVKKKNLHNRVDTIFSAVGEKDGFCTLWYNKDHHGDHKIATETFKSGAQTQNSKNYKSIKIQSLDDFAVSRVSGPISFIKIDVQGFEIPVIKGMEQVLKNNPNVSLAVEYSPGDMNLLGFEAKELIQLIKRHGFSLYLFDKTKCLIAMEPDNLHSSIEERGGYCDLICIRGRSPLNA